MINSEIFEGSCSCSKLQFRLNAEPLIVHACHCRQCQRITGSAFVMNALIKKDEVERLTGDTACVKFPGTCHTAYYCLECATYVWSEYKSGRFNGCWFVRVGTLKEPDRWPPSVHIFTESKQPWMTIPEDVPSYRKFYKIKDTWSKNSIDRMGSCWHPPE